MSAPLGGDQPPDATEFWKALSPLLGVEDPARSYTGSWMCLGLEPSFDARPGLVASGMWELALADTGRR